MFDVANDGSDTFSSLAKYVSIADLAENLINRDGITLFAPTNAAFVDFKNGSPDGLADKLQTVQWQDHLEDLLLYHTVPTIIPSETIITGGLKKSTTLNDEIIRYTLSDTTIGDTTITDIFVNTDAQVIDADINIENGVIHAIDNVLFPPWVSKSIIDTASSNPYKKTLESLVELLGDFDLKDQLSLPGGYTVFAPTNEAFQQDIANGINLSPDQLSSVLSYHVVEGVYPESVLVDGFTLTTLQGDKIRFTSTTDGSGTTMVNDETIITPNILANNGIVHVIDGVLIPDG